jgi:hypothetical protein
MTKMMTLRTLETVGLTVLTFIKAGPWVGLAVGACLAHGLIDTRCVTNLTHIMEQTLKHTREVLDATKPTKS